MMRKIIKIDTSKCNGCGLCIAACHEGAIGLVDGKAQLLRDDYCDGLGNCLPVCPTDAIAFEEREAAAFDEAAVMANAESKLPKTLACGCPGTHSKVIKQDNYYETTQEQVQTHLKQWPVQIKLIPSNASYFAGADLLVAADCTAFAYGNFHNKCMKNKITIIGCPKLDNSDYSEKLAAIFQTNNIKSVTIARMEVPCCSGLENMVKTALQNCNKTLPLQIVIISTSGQILCG
ncbi:MAG: 4Fe-4S binding protein [Candidatus Bathyarchaeota archaeon]|nr:4Fe-4S binding protein [Candidatus Termiticorpusculum sp.]